MKCELSHSRLQGYFDRELNAAESDEFEHHLLGCADCRAELADLKLIRSRLGFAQYYKVAPASLQRKFRRNLGFARRTTGVSLLLFWRWLAAATVLLFVAILLWRVNSNLRRIDYQAELAREIVDAHMHSLRQGPLTAVVSSDGHVVKEWFEKTLKFAVPVRDFGDEGFPLQGGRVDAIEGRPLAALVYAHDGHTINLFIWPTREPDNSRRTGSRQGYQWIVWRKNQIEFCAVSDADLSDLKQLEGLVVKSLATQMLAPWLAPAANLAFYMRIGALVVERQRRAM